MPRATQGIESRLTLSSNVRDILRRIYATVEGTLFKEQSEREYSQAEIPIGRFGEPAEIAAVAIFLASPLASYVMQKGRICMDGGLDIARRFVNGGASCTGAVLGRENSNVAPDHLTVVAGRRRLDIPRPPNTASRDD
jgi:hypothetical protein